MYWRVFSFTCLALLLALPLQAQNAGDIPWYDAEADSLVWLNPEEAQAFLEQQGSTTETASLAQAISTSLNESDKLTASDAEASDLFGFTVSLSGNRAIVGAAQSQDDGFGSGSAYIFDLVGGVWTETQKLTASDASSGDSFGISVSLSGDRALIGAHQNQDNGFGTGSAYIFDLSSDTWTETQKLTASDAASGDLFGISVSLSGDRALIGAYQNDDAATSSGSAYIFDLEGGVWAETQKLTASDGGFLDFFGISVSLSGDRALIGAFGDDTNSGSDFGAAYIFDLTEGVWAETTKLTALDGNPFDDFGLSVSLIDDRALIGARSTEDNGFGSGSAYVFDLASGVWNQTQKLLASDGAANDLFGSTVTLSDDRALIGAFFDDDNGSNSGSAYVFDLDGGVWTETYKLTPSDGAAEDRFGLSISLEGNLAFIGSYFDDDGGNNSGSVYVFTFASPDSDGDGYTDDEEITCGTDPNDAASFPAGTVSGNITADGGFLAGIAVKTLDADDPAIVLGTGVTDASGNYGITGVAQGDIVVMVVEPLGFSAQANDLLASVVCNTTTAGIDFTLDGLTLVNDIRTASYWKNELDIAASGGNSAEDFATIIAEIQTRFTDPYFNTTFAGADDVNDWLDIFSKRPGTLTDRAKIELAALVMNVMSMKVSQFEVVTDDGFTVADVITAAAMLLEDGDPSNDNAAKLWAEQVNRGMTIAAGQIGAGNIAYERNDEGAHQTMNVQQATKTLPESFELTGNYPNPFNPMTTIRFAMPEAAHVTLTVFNTLGQQVVQLVDSPLSAGHHELNFEAGDLPSGTYLYRLETPQGSFTKTMLLLK